MDYFELNICGLKRNLPLTHLSKNTRLASFSILGDVELVDRLADTITEKLKKYSFDYLVGPEVKVVPLIHGVAKRLGHKRFIICRKSVKPYMINPVILRPLPQHPKHIRPLVINGLDAEMLKDKKVVLIDDVVSTGITMKILSDLMTKIGAKVTLTVSVLKQGVQQVVLENYVYLNELPIIKSSY